MLYPDSWLTTLPAMLAAMLGIFLVIGGIMGIVYLLNFLTRGTKKKGNDEAQ